MEEYVSALLQRKKENTVLSYRRDLEALSRHVSPRPLSSLSHEELEAYFSYLSQSVSLSTLSRAISAVRGYYRFLRQNHAGMADVMAGISPASFRRKEMPLLTDDEFEKLFLICETGIRGKRDEAMIGLLCETGIRVSELVQMDRSDLLPEDSAVLCGQGAKRRQLSVSGNLMEQLLSYRTLSELQSKEESALFLGSTGKRITRQGFWKNLKDRAEKLGICDCTPQVLRQSLARILLSRGWGRAQVKDLLGNRSDLLLRKYEKQVKDQKIWDC